MTFANADMLEPAFWDGLRPDPILTVSQWADEHRVLSRVSSAEPGRYRTSRTPPLKQIMDDLSVTSPVQRVVFMKGAQIGATELGNNWVGYVIDHAPGPMLSVMPRDEDAKKNSKIRISPMINASERLQLRIKDARARDSGNTILQKDFPGGVLYMTGANSASGLKSMPVRYLFLDEVDEYEGDLEGQGDPVALAIKRTATFSGKKKVFEASTPTLEGRSRIEKDFLETNQHYYFVPCPKCNHMQKLVWGNMKWDWGKPETVHYECEACAAEIKNWQKTWMLERGEWRATAEGKDPNTNGYHLNALYSPVGWYSWEEAVKDWETARETKDLELLKAFINTVLGETWKDAGEAPDYEKLHARCEPWKRNTLQDGVCFLTAGVDVQEDRVEVEIVGWGRGKRSWSVDYRVYFGDTEDLGGPAWVGLDELLQEHWTTAGGADMAIAVMAVDSGYRTQTVYNWVRKYHISRVVAVKGQERQSVMVSQPRAVDVKLANKNRKVRRGLKLFSIGTNVIKSNVYGTLHLEPPDEEELEEGQSLVYPQGYCHFPDEYDLEHFKRLTAEEIQTTFVNGHKRQTWVKDPNTRNEQLDCRVYARAAANLHGMDRFKPAKWDRLETDARVSLANRTPETPEDTGTRTKRKRKLKRRKSNFA